MEEKVKYQSRLRAKGQVTLPRVLRERLNLREGDQLVFSFTEKGQILVEPEVTIPVEQSWFWTERWQAMEREAQVDIESGKVTRYSNVEEAIEALESDE